MKSAISYAAALLEVNVRRAALALLLLALAVTMTPAPATASIPPVTEQCTTTLDGEPQPWYNVRDPNR